MAINFKKSPTLMVCGKVGNGKRTTINTILGQDAKQMGFYTIGSRSENVYCWESFSEIVNFVNLPSFGDLLIENRRLGLIYQDKIIKSDAIIIVVAPPKPIDIHTTETIKAILNFGVSSNKIIIGYNKIMHLEFSDLKGTRRPIDIDGLSGPDTDGRAMIEIAKRSLLNELRGKFPNHEFGMNQIIAYDAYSGWNIHGLLCMAIKSRIERNHNKTLAELNSLGYYRELVNQAISLIGNGDIEEAINFCLENFQNEIDKTKILLILKARLNALKSDSAKGIIDYSTITLIRNNISNDLLTVLNK